MTMSSTNEDPSSSPRLSFSHDLNPSNPLSPPHILPNSSSSSSLSDFNFSISIDNLQSQDHVLAHEIFSDGKILPLPLKNPRNPSPKPEPPPPPSVPASAATAKKSSVWRFGRSSSLNLGGGSRIRFLRSKSAGSDPSPVPSPNPKPKPRRSKISTPCKSRERRIMGPVPAYFPKERNGMGVIEFLLCSCGSGGGEKRRMEYYCSP